VELICQKTGISDLSVSQPFKIFKDLKILNGPESNFKTKKPLLSKRAHIKPEDILPSLTLRSFYCL